MITTDLDVPVCVLAVGAHPDDVEFGAGALLARWARHGAETHLFVLTDGSKGTWDATADIQELVARRAREQQTAADHLAVSEVHLGGATDGELDASAGITRHVCEVIRTVRPAVVLGHDPWRRYRIHPDHAAAGRALFEGIVAARDPHFFPDLGSPARPSHALLFESDASNHVEPHELSDLDAKVKALLAHRSQWQSTMRINDHPEAETDRFAHRIHTASRAAGARIGLARGEAFRRIDGW